MIQRLVPKLIFGRGLSLLLAGSMTIVAPSVLGQENATSNAAAVASTNVTVPAFDVVSIKQDKSDSRMIRMRNTSDGYSAANVSLKLLIASAYGVREDLLSGVPGWAESARYDIDAKVAGSDVDALKKLSPEQRRSMLKPVLEDRFKLKVHTETKQRPVYELVIAKGGSKLKEATPGDTYSNGIKGPDGAGHGGMMRMSRGQVTGQAIPITSLVDILSRQLEKTVIDKTGLTGKYDLELNWTPEESEGGVGGPPPPPAGSPQRTEPAPDSSGPSLFTALQEQLGLRLQSAKGPVETLVVDHVEIPSEN
jgi:uncharacterized protein (TIGR03435 family)